jgi:hypothetical protein
VISAWASASGPRGPGGALRSRRSSSAAGAPTGVGVGAQPGGQAALGEPGRLVRRREALQEAQRDRAIELGEDADGAGEHELEMGAQLVGGRDAGGDQVPAGPHCGAQGQGLGRVGVQRGPAMAVGAQAIGQHVGVAAIGLVAGQAVAGAQAHDGARGDHDHLQVRSPQGVHDRAVGPLDRHPTHPRALEAAHERRQPGGGVLDGELVDELTLAVDDTGGVAVGRSIDAAEARRGMLHGCLPAGGSVAVHPVVPGRGCWWLTDRRWFTLSPNASRHVLGHRPSLDSCWPSRGKRTWRWAGAHQASAQGYGALGPIRVHQ